MTAELTEKELSTRASRITDAMGMGYSNFTGVYLINRQAVEKYYQVPQAPRQPVRRQAA